MSILRAAPLPTPFKLYGLSLFPAELVPWSTYAGIALTFNSLWSLVWVLTGSSASNLQDALAAGGNSSVGALAGKLSGVFVLCASFAMFSRYAKRKLDVASGARPDADEPASPTQLPVAPPSTVAAAAGAGNGGLRRSARRRSVSPARSALAAK